MAIWQFDLYILPKEEMDSYFPNQPDIRHEDFGEIQWWKFRNLTLTSFDPLSSILPVQKSWAPDLIQFGFIDASCIQLSIEEEKITEVFVRIDIRQETGELLDFISEYCFQNECIAVDRDMKILNPTRENLMLAIDQYRNNVNDLFN